MSIVLDDNDKKTLGIIKDKINNSENIVISTHRNPDGDAIGSTLALHLYLKSIGKKSRIIINGPVPDNYKFLNFSDEIEIFDETFIKTIEDSDLIFVVDLNDVERTNRPAEALKNSKAYKIVIDHHIEPKEFADLYFVKTEATSAGELIYYLCKHNDNNALNRDISSCLYTAILTDSGSFRFPRTDGTTHRIIADLIECGADPVYLYENIYNIRSAKAIKLLGIAFAGLEILRFGQLCLMCLTKNDFKKAVAEEEDVEDIVEQTLTIRNVKVGILLSESLKNDEIRVSFRSKGDISVRDLAVKFNGGGHKNAAGARFYNQSLDFTKQMLLNEIDKMRLIE